MRKALLALLLAASTLATAGATPTDAAGTTLVTNPVVRTDANPHLAAVRCERGGDCYAVPDGGTPDWLYRWDDGGFGAPVPLPFEPGGMWCDQACVVTGTIFGATYLDDLHAFTVVIDGVADSMQLLPQEFGQILDASCSSTVCHFLAQGQMLTYSLIDGAHQIVSVPFVPPPGPSGTWHRWNTVACSDDGAACVVTAAAGAANQVEGLMAAYSGGSFGPVTTTPRMIVALSCRTARDCVGTGVRFSSGSLASTSVVSLVDGVFGVHELPENVQTPDGTVGSTPLSAEPSYEGFACDAALADCWIAGALLPSGQAALWHVVGGVPQAGRVFSEVSPPWRFQSLGCGSAGCTALSRQFLPPARTVVVTGLSVPGPADSAAPTASISSPADGSEVLAGAELVADFECEDETGGSGIATCVATVDGTPVDDGAALPTGSAGAHELVVTPTDHAGNVGAAAHATYTVIAGSVVGEVAPGGTVSTGAEATPQAPVQTTLTAPAVGTAPIEVSIEPQPAPPAPQGFVLLGQQLDISAPASTPEEPYTVTFAIDGSLVGGTAPEDIAVFRDGERALPCAPDQPDAVPDPCIESAVADPAPGSDDILITVRTAHFSGWSFGVRVAPTAVDDAGYSTFQGQVLVVEAPGVLGNDEVVDSHGSLPPPLVVVDDTTDLHGSVALGEGGGFTYTPEPGFHGTARFTYRVAQGDAESNTATVEIEVGRVYGTSLSTSGLLVRTGSGLLGLNVKLFGAAARLVADGPDGPQPVAGAAVRFTAGSTLVCTAVTDDQGQATCSSSLQGAVLSVLLLGATATYDGAPGLAPTTAKVPLIK